MITIDLTTLHTLLVLAREATNARAAQGDLVAAPSLAECRAALDTGAGLIERAFAPVSDSAPGGVGGLSARKRA